LRQKCSKPKSNFSGLCQLVKYNIERAKNISPSPKGQIRASFRLGGGYISVWGVGLITPKPMPGYVPVLSAAASPRQELFIAERLKLKNKFLNNKRRVNGR